MVDKENKKKIWVFHHYATPPNMSGLTRAYDFSKQLRKKGYECTIFTSAYLHYSSENIITDKSLFKEIEYNNIPFVFVRTTEYKKSKILRVINILSYYWNVLKITRKYYNKYGKPDVIIGSSAHPLAAIASNKLGVKYTCKSIVEVRDLWPESFVAYDIIKKKTPLLKLLYAGEKKIYKKADNLIFTMEGGKDYIAEQGWNKEQGGPIDIKKVHHINNGVDIEVFNYNKERYILEDEDLDNSKIFKVIYTGSIRRVNEVGKIVEIAQCLKNIGNNNIKFILFGEGDDKEKLENFCKKEKLDNIIFKGKVSKHKIPYILSKSDLNILHFKQSKLKKYGASLNKLFEYFASGKPTISDCEFGYDLIKRYNCGVVIDDASPQQLAEEIVRISIMPTDEYNQLCSNSIKAAQDYDFKLLTDKLTNIIEEV